MNNAVRIVILFIGITAFSLLGCGGGEPAEQTESVEETETVGQEESTDVTPAAEAGGANSAVEAISIDVGTATGELETEENEDWYVFSVEGGETFELTFAPGDEAEAISFDVLNGELDCIWYESNVRPPVTQTFSYMTSAEAGGDYYVEVSQGQPGTYSIELSKQMQNDANSGIDAGNSAVQAIEIATDVPFEGQVGDLDENDWYAFEIPQGDIFTLTFTPGDDTESIDIDIYNSELDCYWYESNVHPGVTVNKTVIMSSSSGDTYYAEVSDGKGAYTLEISLTSQDDTGIGTDAGDRAVDAVPVELGNMYTGLLGDYDEQDWFSVEIAEGQIVGFTVTPGDDGETLDVDMYSPEQDNLGYESNIAAGVTCEMSLPENSPAGTYYLELSDGQGSYSFVIE